MSDDDKLKPTRPEDAAAQAAEFLGFTAGVDFDLDEGKTWHLPNPAYMPPKMKRRYLEHLRFMSKDLDKETIKGTDPITGRDTSRVQTIWPLTYKKKLIDEDELLCVALMGDDVMKDREAYLKSDGETLPEVYERFLNAGGVPGQVQVHWRMMNLQMEERIKRDPKSR
ncbi:MAG: hypothetical protein WBB07_17635 [Mycobacterium sp.]